MNQAERLKKQKMLAEAEAVYHQIQLGGGIRTLVDQNGERIEYQAANLSKLSGYIYQLKVELGLVPCTGPARVFF